MNVIDKFGGPGGWEVAARELGISPLGIEWDDAACATRDAAGLRTLKADVARLDPLEVFATYFPGETQLDGMIGSPPCPAFSMAGKGEGRKALEVLVAALGDVVAGREFDAELIAAVCDDATAQLVLEPMRWAVALRPRWIALEQVPPVLPVWESMAAHLRPLGYSCWAGVLSAERFGVPQTRKRAILLASLDREVREPAATHRRYIAPRAVAPQEESLFEVEAGPQVDPEDRGLLPWVSMAEALGWEDGDLIGFPRRADGGSRIELDGEEYRERDLRAASEPSFGLTEKARSSLRFRANAQSNAAERELAAPAPTITGGHDSGDRVWVRHYDSRGQRDGRTGALNRMREVGEPAPTIAGESRNDAWAGSRPATTVAGDPRVHPPGHKVNQDDVDAGREYEGRAGRNAVRVSVREAAVLQSFPADYPWQGTKTKQFQQVGNAIPPGLALAALRAVVS